MQHQQTPWHAYLALAASMSLVGSYVALSKPLLEVFSVFILAWLRFAIGGIAMLPWLRRPHHESPLDRATRWKLFAQACFGNFLFSICMLFGMRHTSASNAGVIMASLPAVVAIFSALLLRERLGGRALAAIALAMGGIMLYAAERPSDHTDAWLGNALIFAAVCCEALYVVIGKSLSRHLAAQRVSALINLWGWLLMTPLALWTWPDQTWAGISVSLWALLVFYGLAASVWTVWLWMVGLRHVPAHQAGVFTAMLPVSAASVGVLLLGETLSVVQMGAFAMALSGVYLVTTSGRHLTKQT